MIRFTLKKNSRIIRDKLYSISIDVENFPSLLPKYFKSIIIKKSIGNEIFVDEKIHFLGGFLDVKTKHVIVHPKIHEVHILSGPIRGTSFVESYDEASDGTNVTIDVCIKLNGVSKLFLPFGFLIKRQMTRVMDEFLNSAEKFVLDSNDP
ncbi:MAG: SRPBCC family protein [Nitrosopumilus sp.]|nr:SRPBCC family protein [Nitrosopumilus sp.]MDH3794104.1 SRPBCC family protein [Nitrosopumilus sp.]MDH3855630.1 SRPBCC family protein [Nitrosopumilus sp.]